MKNKVTHMSLGLVNRRMLRIGMIVALVTSFVLLIAFFAQVKGSQTTLQLKETLPALAFVLGIAFALIAGIYAYLCFRAHDEVMTRICGKTHLDYLPTDVFQVHEVYLYGGLDEDDNSCFCICLCSVYRVKRFDKPHNEDLAKRGVRYYTHSHRAKVMFCFSDFDTRDHFLDDSAEHRFRRNDGNGGLEKSECPQFANARLAEVKA